MSVRSYVAFGGSRGSRPFGVFKTGGYSDRTYVLLAHHTEAPVELAVLDRVVDPLDAYAASDAAGDLDALDDALDALLAAGWRVEHLHRSYMLVSPTGETWTPPAFAPPVARGPS